MSRWPGKGLVSRFSSRCRSFTRVAAAAEWSSRGAAGVSPEVSAGVSSPEGASWLEEEPSSADRSSPIVAALAAGTEAVSLAAACVSSTRASSDRSSTT